MILALLAIIFLSLFALAVMILAGLIKALIGRASPRRWKVIMGVIVGIAINSTGFRLAEEGIRLSAHLEQPSISTDLLI